MPSDYVSWDAPFDTYDTITFTAPHLKTAPWADPDIDDESFHPQWNQIDKNINRRSHEGEYMVISNITLYLTVVFIWKNLSHNLKVLIFCQGQK